MDFIEMVKELQKDDSQVFVSVSENVEDAMETQTIYAKITDRFLMFSYNDFKKEGFLLNEAKINMNRTWERYISQVYFIDALKAYENGRKIQCVYKGDIITFQKIPGKPVFEATPEEILYGTWYVA